MSKPQWRRREVMIKHLEAILFLLRAGQVEDVAIVVLQGGGYPPSMDFMQPPKNPEALIERLTEIAGWVGNKQKHEEFAAALEVVE